MQRVSLSAPLPTPCGVRVIILCANKMQNLLRYFWGLLQLVPCCCCSVPRSVCVFIKFYVQIAHNYDYTHGAAVPEEGLERGRKWDNSNSDSYSNSNSYICLWRTRRMRNIPHTLKQLGQRQKRGERKEGIFLEWVRVKSPLGNFSKCSEREEETNLKLRKVCLFICATCSTEYLLVWQTETTYHMLFMTIKDCVCALCSLGFEGGTQRGLLKCLLYVGVSPFCFSLSLFIFQSGLCCHAAIINSSRVSNNCCQICQWQFPFSL